MHVRQDFGAELVEQQPRADIGVVRLLLHQRARGHHRGERQLGLADTVIDVAVDFGDHRRGVDAVEGGAGLVDDQRQSRGVERRFCAIGQRHMNDGAAGGPGLLRRLLLGALSRPFIAVQHIGARDFVMFAAHQRQLDLVLDILDMEGAAFAHPPRQRIDDFIRQALDDLVHAARGGGAVALDREKRLGHRDRDLAGVESGNRAVAADYLHRQFGLRRG
jgi:hypothetical protein